MNTSTKVVPMHKHDVIRRKLENIKLILFRPSHMNEGGKLNIPSVLKVIKIIKYILRT